MNYQKLANDIMKAVGGIENVSFLTNCATRLRMTFHDESQIDLEKIKQIEGVVGAVYKGGQYQIIIGTDVGNVRQEIEKMGTINPTSQDKKSSRKGLDSLMETVSGFFTPVIPILIGGGMLKALLTILNFVGILTTETQSYYIINFAADAAFYFLPIYIGYSVASKLKCNPYMGAFLGAILLHPNFTALVSAEEPVSLFGLPVTLVNYSSSVVPSILACLLLKYVEIFAEKVTPKPVKFLMKPLITLIILVPVTLCALGPLGYWIGTALASFANYLNTVAPWLVSTLMGAFMPLLVLTGMHWSFAPIIVQSYASFGYEAIMGPGSFVSNICQGAASLAVALKTKNQELKQIASSAGITALCGVTEPALFGVTLKNKKILYSVLIGGAVGGLYAGINGVVRYTSGTPGLLTFAVFIGENPMNIVHAFISVGIGFVVTFALTYFVAFKETEQTSLPSQTNKKIQLTAPMEGELHRIEDVEDDAFSHEILGKGIAILPTKGEVVAPFDGKVLTAFPTKHAIGLVDENGIELLIHIGIDTVKLEGKYFELYVNSGDTVKKGDVLVKFDIEKIVAEGCSIMSPIVITNSQDFTDIQKAEPGDVSLDQVIMTVQ